MSTPISRLLLLAGVAVLTACDSGFEGLGEINVTRSAPERIELPDGLVVGGTRGWCIDTRTTRTDGETSVVVLGSCAAIAGNAFAPRPEVPGVVTVSVENEAGAVPPADILQGFLTSEAGRAALARDGSAASVEILDSRTTEDLVFVHVEDKSIRPASGAAQDYWRALFGLDGRFVTVSLVGLNDRPIDAPSGFATLAAQVDRILSANSR